MMKSLNEIVKKFTNYELISKKDLKDLNTARCKLQRVEEFIYWPNQPFVYNMFRDILTFRCEWQIRENFERELESYCKEKNVGGS